MHSSDSTADDYFTEKQTYHRCRYFIHKYNMNHLRESLNDWFDGQLDIAKEIGICWHDLYRKDTDLNALFAEAAKREQ